MARQVEMVITADNSKALRAFQKLVDKGIQTGQSLEKAGNKGKESFQGAGKALTGGLNKAIGLIMGAGGLLAAVKLVTAEFENIRDLNRKSAEAQVTLDAARQNMIWNMAGISDQKINDTLEKVKRLSAQVGVSEAALSTAVGSAVSAGATPGQAIAAAGTAARLRPHAPEELTQLTGSLIDISRLTGSSDPMVNAGFLQLAGKESRVVEAGAQAMNIAPALIGSSLAGASPQEALALFGSISRGAADPVGRKSGTAAISLAVQMKEFFEGAPERAAAIRSKRDPGSLKLGGGLSRAQREQLSFLDEIPETSGFGERLDILWQNPTVRKEFLKTATFQAKTGEVVKNLLSDPASQAAREYKQILGNIPTDFTGLSSSAEESIRRQGLSDVNITAKTGRDFSSIGELLATASTSRGLFGIVQEQLPDILQKAGMSKLGQRISGLKGDVAAFGGYQGALEFAREELVAAQGRLEVKALRGFNPQTGSLTGTAREAAESMNLIQDLVSNLDARMQELIEVNGRTAENTDDPKVTKTAGRRTEER